MDVPESLRSHLRDNRHQVTGRGHDWDVADVVDVLHRYAAPPPPAGPEAVAVLSTAATRRVQAERALGIVLHLMRDLTPGTSLHRGLTSVVNLLDVPEAGLSLNRPQPATGGGSGPRYSGGAA